MENTISAQRSLLESDYFFEFFEVFLASVLGSVLSEEFHVKSSMLSLLLGSSFLGMFIGAIFLGRLADKIGRKKAFLINLGIYSIFTFCIALSPNVGFIILFRFLAGLGLGAQPALCDAYLSEIIPTAKRGKYIAWAYTLSFLSIPAEGFLARMLVPLTPLGIEGWRWMFMIGSIGALIVFLTAHLLPESPRWLATAGKWDEAAEVFKKLGGSKTQAEEFRAKASLTQRDAAQQDRQSRPIFQKKMDEEYNHALHFPNFPNDRILRVWYTVTSCVGAKRLQY
ncbi:MFS transporter [Weizmannia sp. FSL W8-0401]|uniref:MFS transporter n=1 Tax=Weizmannia sp. FSL W8-0401 TaxID=2954554 RepID=UPI0030F8E9D7